jgi:hypothetical protein
MQDSDWGYWYLGGYSWASSSSLDVYSESDTTFDLWTVNLAMDFRIVKQSGFEFRIGFGAEYSRMFFEIRNLDQWYPSYNRYSSHLSSGYSSHYLIPGLVLTYTLNSPFFLVNSLFRFEWENFSLDLGMALFTGYFWDSDDHILRKKLSNGSGSVYGLRPTVHLSWQPVNSWALSMKLNGTYQSGNGEQAQNRYETTGEGPAGAIGQVSEKIESLYGFAELNFSLLF